LVAGRGFMPRPRRGGRAAGSSRRPLEGVFPSKLTFGDMIPCPWRFSTVSSFGALPTKEGQGIVSPLLIRNSLDKLTGALILAIMGP
jgi:hypothetical protein